MTLALLLIAAVALVLLAVAAIVSNRSAAGRDLEHELAAGAEREPWAAAALRGSDPEHEQVPSGVRAA